MNSLEVLDFMLQQLGGILADDWTTVKTEKYNNLKRLMDFCSE
jgi:hypothetical protein